MRSCYTCSCPFLFLLFNFFAPTSPLFAPFTLSSHTLRDYVCVRIVIQRHWLRKKIIGCYGHTLHQIFQVHVPICARVLVYTNIHGIFYVAAAAAGVFSHMNGKTLWLIYVANTRFSLCLCVARNVLSFFFLFELSLLHFDVVVVWRISVCSATDAVAAAAAVVAVVTFFCSSIATFTFFSYIIFHQCRCHFAILQMNFFFFQWCDVKCLSNPIKASTTYKLDGRIERRMRR